MTWLYYAVPVALVVEVLYRAWRHAEDDRKHSEVMGMLGEVLVHVEEIRERTEYATPGFVSELDKTVVASDRNGHVEIPF